VAVGREDHGVREAPFPPQPLHLGEVLHEVDPLGLEALHHHPVVDDLVVDHELSLFL